VTLDVIDPGGHRLMRAGLYLDEEQSEPWWDRSTIGRDVLVRYELEDESDEEGPWRTFYFYCKACRDAGLAPSSSIDVAELTAELHRMRAATTDDTPRRGRIDTVPAE
jgi:hypothetical protein